MSTQTTASVVDRETLLANVAGDEEILKEVVDLFLEECPKLMQQIRGAVARHDAATLQRAAHSLKGSVGNFGAKAAQQAALELETAGGDSNLMSTPQLLAELEDEIARVTDALRPMVGK